MFAYIFPFAPVPVFICWYRGLNPRFPILVFQSSFELYLLSPCSWASRAGHWRPQKNLCPVRITHSSFLVCEATLLTDPLPSGSARHQFPAQDPVLSSSNKKNKSLTFRPRHLIYHEMTYILIFCTAYVGLLLATGVIYF